MLIISGLVLLPASVLAFAAENGNMVYVGEDRTIDGNYYAAGASVTIDGKVTGDVFCAGQSIAINGVVEGDVICAGQSISVNGKVGGSLRVAASDINVRGSVARGITVAAANVSVDKDAKVGWDALIAAANVQIRGELGRSLLGAGANYLLGGKINGNVDLYLDNNMKNKTAELVVADTALIAGQLSYRSTTDASISGKAQIKGEVIHKTLQAGRPKKPSGGGIFAMFILAVASALVVGWLLIGLWKKPVIEMAENMTRKFWSTLGIGFAIAVLTPLAAIILAISMVGIRLALLLIWSWLILLMLSKIVAGIAVGRAVLRNMWTSKKDSLGTALIIGVILSWIVFYIPVIGWIISCVAAWWGLGALVLHLKSRYEID